jgi:hypothetical protein
LRIFFLLFSYIARGESNTRTILSNRPRPLPSISLPTRYSDYLIITRLLYTL